MPSLVLLALAVLATALLGIWRGGWWIALFLACGVLSFIVSPFAIGNAGETMLFAQFVVLLPIVAALAWLPRVRKWLGVILPLSATIALYVSFIQHAEESYQHYLQLLELYPLESMEERVPVPAVGLRPPPLTGAAAELLDQECFTDEAFGWNGNERTYHLKVLHESTVDSFLNSPGFGVRRRPTAPEYVFLRGVRANAAVPQPVARSAPPEPSELLAPGPAVAADESLRTLHYRSVADFSYPAGSGYARDRRHVAGFRPHEFSQVPKAGERWAVETVDLVSLLRHPEPVAYVSADLPRMEELKGAPTRPLDAFESSGLTKLRGGDFLVVGEGKAHLRLLGAIPAVRQCVTCHGCERGDLLGAFSYTLRRTEP